jgi:hypothetical protein
MKVSELIRGLQSMQESYGDLKVNLSVGMKPDQLNVNSTTIFLRCEQYADNCEEKAHDEISISDFPY